MTPSTDDLYLGLQHFSNSHNNLRAVFVNVPKALERMARIDDPAVLYKSTILSKCRVVFDEHNPDTFSLQFLGRTYLFVWMSEVQQHQERIFVYGKLRVTRQFDVLSEFDSGSITATFRFDDRGIVQLDKNRSKRLDDNQSLELFILEIIYTDFMKADQFDIGESQ